MYQALFLGSIIFAFTSQGAHKPQKEKTDTHSITNTYSMSEVGKLCLNYVILRGF